MNKAISLALLLVAGAAAALGAGPRLPGRRVEADPNKHYPLEKNCGPWMIMVTAFNARKPDGASQEYSYEAAKRDTYEAARQLAIELRRTFNIEAYTYAMRSHFGEDLPTLRRGRPKQTSYRLDPSELHDGLALADATEQQLADLMIRDEQYVEPVNTRVREFYQVAVLAGNYPTIDHAGRMLAKIKAWNPQTMQALASRMPIGMQPLLPSHARGPLWQAFPTPNPYVPPDYLHAQEPDRLIEQMNQGRYSLYDCPGKYSVQVATFAGRTAVEYHQAKLDAFVKELETSDQDRLQRAAADAVELTHALRAHHWEAYVFHDRYKSIVTVGSFDSAKHPWFKKTIQTFTAKPKGNPAQLHPERLGRWQFDPTPLPVTVPRRPD